MTRVYQETITDATTGQTSVRDWSQAEIDAAVAGERANIRPLSRRQTFLMLASEGLLTAQEAKDAAAGNSIPASIVAVFDGLEQAGQMTAMERLGYEITFLSFQEADRLDPMVPLIVQAAPDPSLITDAVLDQWWQTYGQI